MSLKNHPLSLTYSSKHLTIACNIPVPQRTLSNLLCFDM
jgi:hypothetical protein